MTTYKHIVQVHPVENGEPNFTTVLCEWESESKEKVDAYIAEYNTKLKHLYKAVYLGRVNDTTGELE